MYWGGNAQDTLLDGIIVSYENCLYSTFPLKKIGIYRKKQNT